MEQIDRSMAILIDAENISPKYIGLIIDEANNHGKLNYRRIYGDWTTVKLKKWKDACLKYALTPVQQFASASGKNSSDFSLVIDAMDILSGGKTLGFCIVSSDGDFSKLITRLKEDDMYLIGMGEEKTPISLVNSYEGFIYLDKLYQTIEAAKKVNSVVEKEPVSKTKKAGKKVKDPDNGFNSDTSITSERSIVNYMKILIEQEAEDDGWALWSQTALLLKKKYPGFNPTNYGKNVKKLAYFKQYPDFSTKNENKVAYIKYK